MSIRARLLIATLVLVFAGLLVAGIATYRFLNTFLVDRVDEQLIAARAPVARALNTDSNPRPRGPGDGPTALVPTGTYGARLATDGTIVDEVGFDFDESLPPRPVLPAGLPGSTTAPESDDISVFEADSADGSVQYRLLADALPDNGGTLVVGIPLTDVNATLRRLAAIEIVVTVSVMVALAGMTAWVIRRGLRPLETMATTAGAIAEGDLSRRVEPDNERTEVGRLGHALNEMLHQIEQAFAEREASQERLRRFVADASHELRTPLTSIRGYAELFRRGAADRPDDLAMVLRRIEDEGARMSELVDDLLLLARLDQGRPLEREPLDLAEVVSAAVEAARVVEPDRPISFEGPGRVEVEGDRNRLRQVVDNLLANVRDHTATGTPAHVVITRGTVDALIEVSDEGSGVPPDAAEHLFEPFFRADAARSRATGGAGLGLSIVTAVVEAHGGRVAYAPREGGGSTLRVSLPLMASTVLTASPTSPPRAE